MRFQGVPFGVRQDAILEFMNDLKNLRGVELKDTVLLIIGAHAAEAKLGRFRATDVSVIHIHIFYGRYLNLVLGY